MLEKQVAPRWCRVTGLHFATREDQKAAADLYYKAELEAAEAGRKVRGTRGPPPWRDWPASLRLALRALQRGVKAAEQPWQGLESHWEELSEARQQQLEESAARCLDVLAAGLGLFGEEEVPEARQAFQAVANVRQTAQFLAAVDVNAFTVTDEELREVGLGLYIRAAVFNHAEEPNCLQSFVGRQLVIRTCRPVPEGEELCITYADLGQLSLRRRALLREHFHFDVPSSQEAEARDRILSTVLCGADSKKVQVGWDAECGLQGELAEGECAFARDFVRKVHNQWLRAKDARGTKVAQLQAVWLDATAGLDCRLGAGHSMRLALARELMDACVAQELWQEAIVFAREVSACSRLIYPPSWPMVSLSLARLAKLELFLGNFAAAIRCGEEALHGSGTGSPTKLCWEDRRVAAEEIQQIVAQARVEEEAMSRGYAAQEAPSSKQKALETGSTYLQSLD
ncbi:unnamed protein product [Effrenium voratum]|uniref:SET domain-containing protein n=1 Tax=Effrenium voratum TaxID=2562239 RepID=A0AA36JPT7_9DINO|nr:unnamed protein product [Effrenium voratum]